VLYQVLLYRELLWAKQACVQLDPHVRSEMALHTKFGGKLSHTPFLRTGINHILNSKLICHIPLLCHIYSVVFTCAL
jgi:hypothetical protein